MNPIDQMMQAHGASANSAIAAMFGPSAASGNKASEGPAGGITGFANILQATSVTVSDAVGAVDAGQSTDHLTAEQAAFFASLGLSTPTEEPAGFGFNFAGVASQINGQGQTNGDTAGPEQAAQLANAAGAAGSITAGASLVSLQGLGVKTQLNMQDMPAISGPDFASLPESVRAEIAAMIGQAPKGGLQSEITMATLGHQSGNAHILPEAELRALLADLPQTQPLPVAASNDLALSPVMTVPVAANTAADPGAAGGAATAADAQQPETTFTPNLVAPTGDQAAATTAPADAAQAAATPEQSSLPDIATAAAAAKIVEKADEAQMQAQADADAEKAADGQMVAAGAAQQAASKQNAQANGGATQSKKPLTGAAADKGDGQSSARADHLGLASKGDALTSKAVEPVARSTETLPQLNVARDPMLSLTPERLVGMPEGAASGAVAAGLGGLRGEGSFMSSMNLLGGHASTTLQGHIAKQLNMSVTKAVKAGEQEFNLRLDPAELGRVQVKLRFMDGGRVHAQVIAERPETLELLQRDARGLEKAIEAGGHKAQGANIEFSLDQNNRESAGRAFAEAAQQEKMRDELAARSAGGHGAGFEQATDQDNDIPLDDILPYVSAETGLDIRV